MFIILTYFVVQVPTTGATDLPPLLSSRARYVLSDTGPLVKYSQKVGEDPYHPDNNTQVCWL